MEPVWHQTELPRQERWKTLRQSGATVWFTGLSGSGKSSVAVELEVLVVGGGRAAYLLDGDNLRFGLNADLGFSKDDRDENVRRVGEVARLMADAGCLALVSLISPYREARRLVREMHKTAELAFVEVFVDTPLEICMERDPKGLYEKAKEMSTAGEAAGFTGVDDPYETPENAELVLRPQDGTAKEAAKKVADYLQDRKIL